MDGPADGISSAMCQPRLPGRVATSFRPEVILSHPAAANAVIVIAGRRPARRAVRLDLLGSIAAECVPCSVPSRVSRRISRAAPLFFPPLDRRGPPRGALAFGSRKSGGADRSRRSLKCHSTTGREPLLRGPRCARGRGDDRERVVREAPRAARAAGDGGRKGDDGMGDAVSGRFFTDRRDAGERLLERGRTHASPAPPC